MENQDTPNQENVNQQFNQQFGQRPMPQQFGPQQIPNSTTVLVLGIISLPVCFCYFLFGIPGLVLSIIALVLSNKSQALYNENPSLYTQASFNNMKAGKICAIIGLAINSVCLIGMIIYIAFIATVFSSAFSTFPFR
ncbi:MAG: hypothetical protein JWO44_1217 [Bacteroidetes bacterium]|nr:hypothetical protein [Bacteroidota bacterium]